MESLQKEERYILRQLRPPGLRRILLRGRKVPLSEFLQIMKRRGQTRQGFKKSDGAPVDILNMMDTSSHIAGQRREHMEESPHP
ncbi:hypothetical protein RRG08_006078 [Elysia crispata]|uniref:Uncharacterized protein n=1 Tax=Elysia crispata TaxID=231223 RepID=A0AAE1CUF6_9GAST|nr:hypothetical protein RRG08_006078 [Elysia crispata]